jgi:hypothetical protein
MKKYYLLVLLGVFGLNLMANPVDVETARQLGGKYMTANHRSTSTLTLAYTEKTDAGLDACYVFNCQPKGFVIVAADDRMQPILAYSTESSFNLIAAEDGPRVFFDAYRCDLQTAVAENLDQSSEIREQWLNLEQTGRLANRSNRAIGPLCTSTWHQTQLYNDQCPEDPEGYNGHVKSGCVANAMAQIMRYWEWPKTGVGSHSYYCYGYGSTSYGTLSANFGEAEYHYEFMPDFLDYTSPQYEVDAVALLEYHAGVSVEMNYGPNASGAYTDDAVDALIQYFRYANNASRVDRDYYTDPQWIEMLITEIDNGRPMLYSAYSYTKDGTRGGHAFVCDGYDDNQFFHFNWGWQGFDNGFYSVNAMNLTHHEYNYNHYTTVNLEPNAEYYNQPMPFENVEYAPHGYGLGIDIIQCVSPTQTIGGTPLESVDSAVILMNGNVLFSSPNSTPGGHLSGFFEFDDPRDFGVVNYITTYVVAGGMRGRASIDTVPGWAASGCMSVPLTFCLHDAAGNGWLSPAISVLDERGVVQQRVGLAEGSIDTVVVQLPLSYGHEWTLYWNYCNVGYEDDDEECSFEVYDYQGNLIYSQIERPVVGELCSFTTEADVFLPPDYITAEYVYREDGTMGALVSWGMAEQHPWCQLFKVQRFTDPNSSPEQTWTFERDEFSCFNSVGIGTYYYRVCAVYANIPAGSIPAISPYAPNLEHPELDYAMVTVTSVEEQFDITNAMVKVYNALGQKVFEGDAGTFDECSLKTGVYILDYAFADGRTKTVKLLRP